MDTQIPKIQFSENENPNIEVMTFRELIAKLAHAKQHDPYKAHKIDFHLILIVTNKSCSHFVDFNSYELEKGTAIFVAKNQVHHFNKDIRDAKGIAIVLNGPFMEKYHFLSDNIKLYRLFNYHIGTPTITQSEMGEDSFVDIGNLLYKEFVSPNSFAKSEMMQTLIQVLLLRAERSKEVCSSNQVKPRWLELFSEFKNLLEVEYVETRNARIYAQKLFISYKFLNDIVKQLTDKTVKAFIDDFVTIEIKRKLASTSLSVKEIAYEVGFLEPANMVKFFKRNAKITPLTFRDQI